MAKLTVNAVEAAINPIAPAIERTKSMLFQPFVFTKWAVLALPVFLMQLPAYPDAILYQAFTQTLQFLFLTRRPNDPSGGPDALLQWLEANPGTVLGYLAGGFVVYLAIKLLTTWISSRAYFIFLGSVVRNEAAFVGPWKEFARLGDSLTWFRFGMSVVFSLIVIGITGLGVLLAWEDIENRTIGGAAITAYWVFIALLSGVGLVFNLVTMLLDDLVIPIMFLGNLSVWAAWREFWNSLVVRYLGAIVMFVIARVLIGMAVGTIVCMLMGITLCLAAVPYVGHMILMPIFVFDRCYPLIFLEQFGPQWQAFQDDAIAMDDFAIEDFPYHNYPAPELTS